MTLRSTVVSLLLLVTPSPLELRGTSVAAPAAKRTITHEDVFTMARTSRPVVSPDGKWIVYNVTEPSYDPAKTTADPAVPTERAAASSGSTPSARC